MPLRELTRSNEVVIKYLALSRSNEVIIKCLVESNYLILSNIAIVVSGKNISCRGVSYT